MAMKLSRTGLIFGALYVIFVIFLVAQAEHCFGNDGLLCELGYLAAGIPWTLTLTVIPERWLPQSAFGFSVVFFTIVILSILLNLLLVYRYGRLLGTTAGRGRAKVVDDVI